MGSITWERVKEILDTSLKNWEISNGREPKMRVVHDGPIGWSTKQELLESAPYGLVLIEESKIGCGKADETNLIKILTRNIGAYRRMPSRGPYLSAKEIQEISDWIDSGIPD